MEPLVSVVIPVYRTEAYLNMCLESVRNQTYRNVEIILVDDESPDDCPRLCEEYARQDSRIKVVHRKNGGLSAARNSGLEIATGEYVTFIDSDDCVALDMVAHMVELAQKEQADLVKICLIRCYDGKMPPRSLGSNQVLSGVQVLHTIYSVPQQIISACGKLFRRELFREIRFPEGRHYEDEYTTPKLYALSDRVVLSESVMYFYMQWDNGSIMRSGLTEKKVGDALDMTFERVAFFRELGLSRMVGAAIQDHYLKQCALIKQMRQQPELSALCTKTEAQRRKFAREHPCRILKVQIKQVLSHIKRSLIKGGR